MARKVPDPSLSIEKIRPGYVKLGPNRIADRMMFFFSVVMAASGVSAELAGRAVAGTFLLLVAGIMIWFRRRAQWASLTVEGDRVTYRSINSDMPILFTERALRIETHEFRDEDGETHFAPRIYFSHPDCQAVTIQTPLFFRFRANREEAWARVHVTRLRESLGLSP